MSKATTSKARISKTPKSKAVKSKTAKSKATKPKMARAKASAGKAKISIFRARQAPFLTGEDGHFEAPPPGTFNGWGALYEAGLADGTVCKRLFDFPGFSLVYNWFKPNFPLPLHSHGQDCLYYIVSGSLEFGTEKLGPGDGFFVPANTPYTYRMGPQGVEVLEFRHSGWITIKPFAASQNYWDKAISSVVANLETWKMMDKPRPAA